MKHFGYKDRKHFRLSHLKPLIEEGFLSMTFPDIPNHQEQKYVTTEKGKDFIRPKTIAPQPQPETIEPQPQPKTIVPQPQPEFRNES